MQDQDSKKTVESDSAQSKGNEQRLPMAPLSFDLEALRRHLEFWRENGKPQADFYAFCEAELNKAEQIIKGFPTVTLRNSVLSSGEPQTGYEKAEHTRREKGIKLKPDPAPRL